MKKFKLSLTIAIGAIALGQAEGAAVALAGGFFGYDAYQEATMTAEERLIQANLEALTGGEIKIDCPIGQIINHVPNACGETCYVYMGYNLLEGRTAICSYAPYTNFCCLLGACMVH